MEEGGSLLPLVDAAPDFRMGRWGILLCNSRALLSPAGMGLDPKQAPRFPDTLQVGKRTHLKHMGLLEPQVPPKGKDLCCFLIIPGGLSPGVSADGREGCGEMEDGWGEREETLRGR